MNECIFTSEYNKQKESEKYYGGVVCAFVTLDWMVSMAVICFHPSRQNRTLGIDGKLMSGKDVFRRLFAFYRSSLLEICRIFSNKWQPTDSKNISKSSPITQHPENEYSIIPSGFDLENNSKSQFPKYYRLKISISSGAIAREKSEIDLMILEFY